MRLINDCISQDKIFVSPMKEHGIIFYGWEQADLGFVLESTLTFVVEMNCCMKKQRKKRKKTFTVKNYL